MNWDEYKKQVKKSDPIAKEILEESEAEAAIISALIIPFVRIMPGFSCKFPLHY